MVKSNKLASGRELPQPPAGEQGDVVIAAFQSAFDSGTLSDFVQRVDIYGAGVWCNGENH